MTKLNSGITAFFLMTIVACGGHKNNETAGDEKSAVEEPKPAASTTDNVTYQHIALAKIKDDRWDEYIAAMHNNIANSRQEPGNIIFTLFQPEEGTHEVAFMERFKNRTVFGEHLKADYLPEVITKESLIGDMEIRELEEVAEIPAVEPENADEVLTPRNVIVFFDVKPEQRGKFIAAVAELTPHSRQAEGNVRFNIFQEANDENKFVLLESWENMEAHEAHLAMDYSASFDEAVTGVFVTNPMDGRLLVKDISQ